MGVRLLAVALCGALGCGAEVDPSAQPPVHPDPPPESPAPPDAGLGVWQCQPGELILEDGGCLPAGIVPADCPAGFEATGDFACAPILPAAKCAPGTMALPGERSCHTVAPCAPGTWGNIVVEANTQFVDGSFAGVSDGTAAAPWADIQSAVDAAAPGAVVAVAGGSYVGEVQITKQVRLWGRCPELVEIRSPGTPGVNIVQGGDLSEVRDLSITDSDVALHVGPSVGVKIDRVWIHDARLIAIDVEQGNPGATITRSLVERQRGIGIFGYGAELTIEDSIVRDMDPNSNGAFGDAVRVWDDAAGVPTALTVRRSMIDGAYDQGIIIRGSDAEVHDTVVRNVMPEIANGLGGEGILANDSFVDGGPSTLLVIGSVVENVHYGGIVAENAPLRVERTVVRNVMQPPGYSGSFGIVLTRAIDGVAPELSVRSSVVEGTRLVGVGVVDASGSLEAVIVRDTLPSQVPVVAGQPDVGGRGIEIDTYNFPEQLQALAVRGCIVERAHEMAVSAIGAHMDAETTLIRDISLRDTDGLFGRGFSLQIAGETLTAASGTLRDSLVERTHDHAVAVIEAQADIESLWIREVGATADGQFGRGIAVQAWITGMLPASATVRRSLVEGVRDTGIVSVGAELTVESTIVRGVASNGDTAGDGIAGASLFLQDPTLELTLYSASLDVHESIVAASERSAISSFAAEVTVGGSWLDCNVIDLNGELIFDAPFLLDDLGGNACGCDNSLHACKVLSAGLSPPVPAAN